MDLVDPCPQCQRLYGGGDGGGAAASSPTDSICKMCLGLFQDDFARQLQTAVERAMEPYNTGTTPNRFSKTISPPVICLSGHFVDRLRQVRLQQRQQREMPPQEKWSTTLVDFSNAIKKHSKKILNDTLKKIEKRNNETTTTENCLPACVHEEELGYLGVHVIVTPASADCTPSPFRAPPTNKRKRKRFMNHMDGPQQGGDPRLNHELRLLQQREWKPPLWTLAQAVNEAMTRGEDAMIPGRKSELNNNEKQDEVSNGVGSMTLDISVAIWRRPFYLASSYTKIRRDVSQTPFFVSDQGGTRQRLGVASVEEQILPAIERHVQGISALNNDSMTDPNKNTNKDQTAPAPTVLYGMAKFHASGREDMDVRMIIPPAISTTDNNDNNGNDDNTNKKISGRPFVCEIIDANQMPSMATLPKIVADINNHSSVQSCATDEALPDTWYYGNNPMGVGIAPELKFVSSEAFKQLQAQTESKVKHYGCLCWSQEELPDTDALLNDKIARFATFPLKIDQRTPLRVLHRRSNMIRVRHVLTCHATRIDSHHFRLRLSTDAGTYVKEFVHGDLGRTIPSMATLLGCKTDILELDCEGIQMEADL